MTATASRAEAAVIAAQRFGFGEPGWQALADDPQGWVLQQFRQQFGQQERQPDPLPVDGLLSSAEAGAISRRVLNNIGAGIDPEVQRSLREQLRRATLAGWERRWQHTLRTTTPVHERWVQFWANHFCVSGVRGAVNPLVLPYEREAIRPHVAGRFVDLLSAATRHPAMLIYLDNAVSIGPQSRAGLRRARGLNENLARELLELHTLGVSGYTQADVTEVARLLTGWTVTPAGELAALAVARTPRAVAGAASVAASIAASAAASGPSSGAPAATTGAPASPASAPAAPAPRFETEFNANWHEPGARQILGRRYGDGPEALEQLLTDLARHPATARHVSQQLARHFVADVPPAALVDALVDRWRQTDGDLAALADTLFRHPEAWRPGGVKVKRPEEWLLSAHRVLGLPLGPAGADPGRAGDARPTGRATAVAARLAGSGRDWLGPDALMKRVEWALRFAQRDAARLTGGAGTAGQRPADWARAVLGPALQADTLREVERADSGAQALALWLVSPEFLRR